MSGFESGILAVIEFLCGSVAASALGRQVSSYSLGRVADGLIGGIGGLLFVWPSLRIPGVARFMGHLADGLTPTMLVGAGIAGFLGGFILMALVGFASALIRGRR